MRSYANQLEKDSILQLLSSIYARLEGLEYVTADTLMEVIYSIQQGAASGGLQSEASSSDNLLQDRQVLAKFDNVRNRETNNCQRRYYDTYWLHQKLR